MSPGHLLDDCHLHDMWSAPSLVSKQSTEAVAFCGSTQCLCRGTTAEAIAAYRDVWQHCAGRHCLMAWLPPRRMCATSKHVGAV